MQGCSGDSPDQPGKAVWTGRAQSLPPHRHRFKTTFTNSPLRPRPTFYQNLSCAKQALCNLCRLLFLFTISSKKSLVPGSFGHKRLTESLKSSSRPIQTLTSSVCAASERAV